MLLWLRRWGGDKASKGCEATLRNHLLPEDEDDEDEVESMAPYADDTVESLVVSDEADTLRANVIR